MNQRTVTEHDFRMPEFRDAKPEDYEFRRDGKLVRKDRWEMAVQSVRFLVGIDGREFEIEDVLERVRAMASQDDDWVDLNDEAPSHGAVVDVRLQDGSMLARAVYDKAEKGFDWNRERKGMAVHVGWSDVVSWRGSLDEEQPSED